MSFDQLMQHARDIQQKAIMLAKADADALSIGSFTGLDRDKHPLQRAKVHQRIEESFADVPSIFEPFAEMPDPGAFGGLIDPLKQALQSLALDSERDPISNVVYPGDAVMGRISASGSFIGEWTGKAAREFKANFVDPFPVMAKSQFVMIAVLRSALEAEREIWTNARNDIDNAAHQALEALDRINECGKNEWNLAFTVAASVAAIGALPMAGSALTAVTAVGAASQVAAAGTSKMKDSEKLQFSGESPEAVIQELRVAADKLATLIDEQETIIARAMISNQQLVSARMDDMVANRPALTGMTQSNVASPEYMGYST
ncbi:hypothetical protein [Micromonospora zhanjiangensis]|uniref:Proteins of 100 residues with WXG n=1 Tax=Micromonospora zhanjiangensis TaxID=1522057 RepID=A0ABV8KNM3_9ACTN